MSITVNPTTFDLGKIEDGQSTTSYFSISTPDNVTNVSATSNSSMLTLRKGNTGAFTSSISSNLNNEAIDINVSAIPTVIGSFNGTITVTYNSSTIATITYTFEAFATLANYSDIYVKSIYARDGIFNANTVKIGTSSISMTEKGDKLNFTSASGISYNIGKATQLDDGRIEPITSISIDKEDNSILIKNNKTSTMKIDQDGTIRSSGGTVILSSDVTVDSNNDWKLERDSAAGTTALYKLKNNVWVKRVGFS
tara:strand:- start:324 stop:1082 length:759 start_codon:yes stop_codon:yes gene_type:complete